MENLNNPIAQPSKKNALVAFLQAKRSLPTWVIILGIVLACALGHATGGSASTSDTTNAGSTAAQSATTSSAPSSAVKSAPTATPKPAPKLTTIASFSGTTQKNTADFQVTADQ